MGRNRFCGCVTAIQLDSGTGGQEHANVAMVEFVRAGLLVHLQEGPVSIGECDSCRDDTRAEPTRKAVDAARAGAAEVE